MDRANPSISALSRSTCEMPSIANLSSETRLLCASIIRLASSVLAIVSGRNTCPSENAIVLANGTPFAAIWQSRYRPDFQAEKSSIEMPRSFQRRSADSQSFVSPNFPSFASSARITSETPSRASCNIDLAGHGIGNLPRFSLGRSFSQEATNAARLILFGFEEKSDSRRIGIQSSSLRSSIPNRSQVF